MCDSITILVLLPDQSPAEYERCQYPSRGKEDTDEASSDFRIQYPRSPLTGAGYKVTAVGEKLSSKSDVGPIEKNRKIHGRVDGYLVNLNPPACTVGHNRLLVNGVPAAIDVGLALLKHWLAENGCTREGLDAVVGQNVDIVSATPTFLFSRLDEPEARLNLAQFRGRSIAVCNGKMKGSVTRPPAFSVPPKPPKRGEYIYNSYIKLREYLLDCYVKRFGAKGSVCIPITDHTAELTVAQLSNRTLRIGTKLHGKWLKDHDLNKAANWQGSNDGYEKAFALVRSTLRLDEDLRTKQIRSQTVAALNLPESDKTLLRYHLDRNKAREHPRFSVLSPKQASKAYSASRLRILESTKIDLDINYEDQLKTLIPSLGELLVFPGQYEPSERIAQFIFSPVSVPIALERLAMLTDDILRNRDTAASDETRPLGRPRPKPGLPPFPSMRKNGEQLRYTRGISKVPVDFDAIE